MNLTSNLREALSAYDGKATNTLTAIERSYGEAEDYIISLIALTEREGGLISEGATWLLKHHLDAGKTLTPPQTDALFAAMDRIETWSAQLHICQLLRNVQIPEIEAVYMAHWLTPLLSHERPFLRAWSLDAFCHLASQHGAFRSEARAAVDRAIVDPSAAVRARARQLSP